MKKKVLLVIIVLHYCAFLFAQNNPGETWFTPSTINVEKNQDLTFILHLNSGNDKFSAFNIEIQFDPLYVDINVETGIIPIQGGSFLKNSPEPGIIKFSGTYGNGIDPAPDISLFSVRVMAKDTECLTPIIVKVHELVNPELEYIGKPHEVKGRVKITEYIIGDYNNDSVVDIIDALLIAQLYVGLEPVIDFPSSDIDTDCNGEIDIIDALLIAQFYVGIITEFCTQDIDPTLTPTEPPPEPTTEPGDMWVYPSCFTTTYNKEFELGIHLNSGSEKVCAYQCEISYDNSILSINPSVGFDGVIEGNDGFIAAINSMTPGLLKINSFDFYGKGPGSNLELLRLAFQANKKTGSSNIYCSVSDLSTYNHEPIHTSGGTGGLVRVSEYIKGDADGDGMITVKDAVYVEMHCIGPDTGIPPWGLDMDTNCDNEIWIEDYIEIMKYIVRIVDEFCDGNYIPAPIPTESPTSPGDVWISPSKQNTVRNKEFSCEIHLDSGDQKISSFDIQLGLDSSFIEAGLLTGLNGVSAGVDGFVDEVILDDTGSLRIKGNDIQGTGPGNDLHLLTISLKSKHTIGETGMSLIINTLEDPSLQTIGTPEGIPGIVKIHDIILGDANRDTLINIVDAYCVSTYPNFGFTIDHDPENCDVNQDGYIDIIDCLLIAQYSAGLIDSFPTQSL